MEVIGDDEENCECEGGEKDFCHFDAFSSPFLGGGIERCIVSWFHEVKDGAQPFPVPWGLDFRNLSRVQHWVVVIGTSAKCAHRTS